MFDSELRHILAVDDDHICGKIYQLLAERLHFKIDVVQNCHEALSAISAKRYDVILMDIGLPDCDGVICARFIRQLNQKDGGHAPIIAITAHAMTGDEEAFLSAGMDDYLSKPFSIDEFKRKILRWLSTQSKTQDDGYSACDTVSHEMSESSGSNHA